MKEKKFLIDTSVLLDNPRHLKTLYQNGENEIFITDIVLQEINKNKEDGRTEKGYLAREFIRAIDRGISRGIPLDPASKIKKINNDIIRGLPCVFEENGDDFCLINIITRPSYDPSLRLNDDKILTIAKEYNLDLITNDITLKVKALSSGVHSESLKEDTVSTPDKIDFCETIEFQANKMEQAKEKASKLKNWTQIRMVEKRGDTLTGKEEFFLKVNGHLEKITEEQFQGYKVKPLNIEQKFYAKMLSSNFQIMVVTGSTGSGKTLLALQEGMRRVSNPDDPIDGIVYMRNTVTANDPQSELGFRKGDENQKLGYFAYPLYGAINFIIENTFSKKESLADKSDIKRNATTKEEHTQKFMSRYNVEVMDIAHARGITIPNKFVIFDEGQNASNATVKLIGTRIGKGSRLLIMGDFKQVDHVYLSQNRNALVTMLEKAKEGEDIAGIQLRKTIRSDIADWFDKNL